MSVFRTVKAEGVHEEALRRACEKLGFTLSEGRELTIFGNKVNARWCVNAPNLAYPIGVTTDNDNNIDFHWDNWLRGGGHTDIDVAQQLREAYAETLGEETDRLASEAEEYARQQGWVTAREVKEDGTQIVTVWLGE